MESRPTIFKAPCYTGIVEAEGNHRYKMQHIGCGNLPNQPFEVRICHGAKEEFFAGHVLNWWSFIYIPSDIGQCQAMDADDPRYGYLIVHTEDEDWHKLHGNLTYDDLAYDNGKHRPVLARNCHNTPDDKDTVCDGGKANFTQEITNARPTRSPRSAVDYSGN